MKVYKFGALEPTKELDAVKAQIRLGHEYYNTLVRCERDWRQAAHTQTILELGDLPTKETPAEEKKAWYQRRIEIYKENQPQRHQAMKDLRAEFGPSGKGLYWGTYLLIERAFDMACRPPKKKKKSEQPTKPPVPWEERPHFRSWQWASKLIGVQIQKGNEPRNLFRIVDKVSGPKQTWKTTGRKSRTLMLRIGTSEDRKPIWCEVPMKLHREIDGDVRWVSLHLRTVADRDTWTVCFSVENYPSRATEKNDSVAAVDIGWTFQDDQSIRIAHVIIDTIGHSRHSEDVFLPPTVWNRYKRADDIQARRKLRFNQLLEVHGEDLRALGVTMTPKSVRHLLRQLGDAERPDWLSDWLRRDKNLWRREAYVRRKATNTRRKEMELLVARLRAYKTVIVEDIDWKALKEEKDLWPEVRNRGFMSAPGELSALLKEIPGAVIAMGAYSSLRCSACGHTNDSVGAHVAVCERCSDERPRRDRACRNLLKDHKLGKTKLVKKEGARKTRSRFAKSKKDPEPPNNGIETP